MDYEGRLKRVREEMRKRDIGMMFLHYGANLWYLAGIPRREPDLTDSHQHGDYVCGAYIGADSGFTLVASRLGGGTFYQREAENKPWIEEVRLIYESERPEDVIAEVVKSLKLKGKGVSVDNRAWAEGALCSQSVLPDSPFSVASDIIAPMRMIKDADEIAVMQKAGQITDEVYGEVVKFLKVNVTEYDVTHEIDYQLAKKGVSYPAFRSGVRFSSLEKPSGVSSGVRASSRKLKSGDAISFDFGALYNGYCSDFGRTAFMGKPPAEFVKAYGAVIEAQAVAIKAMVSGTITCSQVNSVAHNVMEEAGYGDKFMHHVGHSVGVNVHESPYLRYGVETVLLSGMIFAIEPSMLDRSGFFCRVGDIVIVTEKGGVSLTNFDRKLTVV